MMLCSTDSIEGEIEPDYVKKQLYVDKQENILSHALLIYSKIVNLIRKISLKKSEEPSFLSCYSVRHLRNILVKFAGKKTKFTERSLFPVTDENSSQAVHVNHSTLYRLFQSEYTMFDAEEIPFTFYQDIRSDQQKEAIWKKIYRILQECKLRPLYLLGFNNQYDVVFYGSKPSSQQQTETDEMSVQETPSVRPSSSKAKTLNEAIKTDKKE